MRKLLFLLVCILTGVNALAEKITQQEAFQKAVMFMPDKQFKMSNSIPTRTSKDSPVSAYYIFNAENEGFVIVAGDDCVPSILGYSERGNLYEDKIPCNVKWLLDYYEQTISNLSSSRVQSLVNNSNTKADISPMLDTEWGQGEPYNRLSPIVEDQRCVAGCSATALAQVIYYNRWPQGSTSSVPAYTTITHQLEMPELPPTQFDWNNMGENALSRLMQYCGQAILMDYGPNESGALPTDYAPALKQVFGYNSKVCIEARSDYSDNEWNELIYKELSEGRVVVYSGYPTLGSGHSFVIDGYKNGRYHINWGWNGNFDGYFTLNYLNPNGISFNIKETAIINITAPDGNRVPRSNISVTNLSCSRTGVERAKTSENFPSFTVECSIESNSSSVVPLQVGIGLYDDFGLVSVLEQENHQFMRYETFKMTAEVVLASSLPDGPYRVVPIIREGDTAEWETVSWSTKYCVSVVINKLSATLQSYQKGGSVKEYGEHIINGVNYRLYSEYGNNKALVMPLQGEKKYRGDIYVQDTVSYQNMFFEVEEYALYEVRDKIFSYCPDLSSLSLGYYAYVTNCPNLTKLEIREGNVECYIGGLPKVESIVFPSSCSCVNIGSNWDGELINIKSISFQNPRQMNLGCSNFGADRMPSLTDLYLYCAMPPEFSPDSNQSFPSSNVKIHIPNGTIEAYKNSLWKGCNLIDDLPLQEGIFFDYCGMKPNFDFFDISGWSGINAMFKEDANKDKDTELAIKIPADYIAPYKGGKVTKIVYFAEAKAVNGDNSGAYEYAFITKPGSDYLVKAHVTTKKKTWNEVQLDEPYTITGDDLYVGIGRHGGIEMSMVNGGELNSGIWVRSMGNEVNYDERDKVWEKFEDYQIRTNTLSNDLIPSFPLPIQIFIEGSNLPTEMRIIKLEKDDTTHHDRVVIKVKVRSRSPQLITRFSLGIYDNGKLQDIQSFEKMLVSGYDDEVEVSVPKREDEGYHTVKIRVLEVNDGITINNEGNEASTFYMQPFTSTLTYPRKIVMEMFSEPSCGYSPRGIETIKIVKELYPDNFIPIVDEVSVFGTNPMYDPGNGYFRILGPINAGDFRPLGRIGEIPTCVVNRKDWFVPSPDKIIKIIEEEKNNAKAQIAAKACFYDADSTKVLVTTQSQFGFNSRGSEKYGIAYVVLEDHVGPYEQDNYFSGRQLNEEYDYLEWWTHQNSFVEMYFDNVVRGIYDSWIGTTETTPQMIMAGENYNGQYLLTLPEKIQHKKNLHLVTLLIDRQTAEIMNADYTSIEGSVLQEPIVIAKNATKKYGDPNPAFNFQIYGNVDGTPAIVCEANEKSQVGTYPINISLGGHTNNSATCVAGTLTVFEAPLLVSTGSYQKEQGDENPTFTLIYEGFKNNETESVLTQIPTVTTTATKDSEPGEYSLMISGGEAHNYELSYQNGILIVTESSGISIISASQSSDIYSLQGHKVRTKTKEYEGLPKGIYIVNGRKLVIK